MWIVKSKIVTVYGEPWYWKSFFCLFISIFYEKWGRVYSNIEFKNKWKSYSRNISSVKYLEKIPFNDTEGLIVMDEMGWNANSRKSSSEKNLDLVTQLTMYPRKKNCSVLFWAQTERMFDVYIREMAFCEIQLLQPHSYFESWEERLMFRALVKRKGEVVKYLEMELFLLLDMWYDFNSMDKSIVDHKEVVRKNAEKVEGEVWKTKEETMEDIEKAFNKKDNFTI